MYKKIQSYFSVTEPSDLVHELLLDHEGSQVRSVTGQEDHGKEGPHGHYELTGRASGVLYWYRVIEYETPQKPDGLADCERWTVGVWR